MGTGKDGWGYMRITFTLVIVVIATALLVSGCGGSSGSDGGDVSFTGEAHPNVDIAGTRNSKGPIKTTNVTELDEAWNVPIEGEGAFGSYAASPVAVGGVVYSQDLASNVQAIEQESGDVLWTRSFELPSLGPNGVAVAEGRVYGATPSEAFALDQETGKQLWSVQLTRNEKEGIDMAPGVKDGVVFVSTVPTNAGSLYAGEGVGILWALDAKTGKKLWKFNTVPNSLWGNPKVNSGGGLWYTPAFDEKGFVYFGVGNPAPFPGAAKFPFGSSRPGPNLYTNSIVKLDAKTGKKEWHFQLNPHDIYDWDLQGPPILVNSKGRELVLAAGKVGFVIALDAKTGALVWKRSVGVHNGHDEDGLYAMRGEYSRIKKGTVYPGVLGGVIAPMSTDGTTVFAPVVNSPAALGSGEEPLGEGGGPSAGELVAIDVATGAVKWKHEFAGAPAYGSTSVTNDLVFATTFDGKVHAFDTGSGRLAWQVTLPAATNAGVAISGNTVIAPAGLAMTETQTPQIVAYRLGG
jgi:outer membrane protein assembly factor BamB